ncbi:hypothetical protein CCACVL1_01619, partial [Corchorus capsularis]
ASLEQSTDGSLTKSEWMTCKTKQSEVQREATKHRRRQENLVTEAMQKLKQNQDIKTRGYMAVINEEISACKSMHLMATIKHSSKL